MLHIVLDTNVLISGTITKTSPPGKILHAFVKGEVEIIISPSLMKEYMEKLTLPRITKAQWMNAKEVAAILELLQTASILAPGALNLTGISRDPKDDMVISAAVEMSADYIVTGDDDLLALEQYKNINILSPTKFVSLLP